MVFQYYNDGRDFFWLKRCGVPVERLICLTGQATRFDTGRFYLSTLLFWVLAVGGWVIILICRFHYTLDIYIGVLLIWTIFKLYHHSLETAGQHRSPFAPFIRWFENIPKQPNKVVDDPFHSDRHGPFYNPAAIDRHSGNGAAVTPSVLPVGNYGQDQNQPMGAPMGPMGPMVGSAGTPMRDLEANSMVQPIAATQAPASVTWHGSGPQPSYEMPQEQLRFHSGAPLGAPVAGGLQSQSLATNDHNIV